MENSSVELESPERPLATLLCMGMALVVILLLPDWTGTGTPRPIWLLASPMGLGIVGAVFALKQRALGWAICSAVLGLALLPLLVVIVTLIGGP